MAASRSTVADALTRLLQDSPRATFEQIPALLNDAAMRCGLGRVRLFVADLQQVVLREVTGRGRNAGAGGQELKIDSTLAGRAYQTEQALSDSQSCGRWVPVTDGTQRLGVLHLRPDGEARPDPQIAQALAAMTGLLLTSKRPQSDSYAQLIRTRAMAVSAEVQWTLMPPPTFANDRVTVSAAMEPAYQVAGDGYDYAICGDTVHMAVFDAMGHNTTSGLTASLVMAACRNVRRQGADPAEVSRAIEDVLIRQFDHKSYATGILADLDLNTGVLSWVNRGHLLPIIIRGRRWAITAHCPPAGPMGTGLHLPISVCQEQLEPGDRLLLYTDGITEARGSDGQQFGVDRFTDFVIRHHADAMPVAETLRRLIHTLLDHQEGRLDDDATVLVCQWNGPNAP
ncbi:PP2C family protein-serine/threonine phosphatase [Streptomyces sp. CBMA29]|uniref:PP2C family protein-serine/threonine phosphatase n=1 Tax=Streptomyces sp. CBMA29 TaxID=1896314 RepID=UPI001CB7170A|nr:PP2C family protein-serine/threonine phosphatase [Streptomyces sp. CBMA29]MBD0740124.1 stage II sporulation protein E [Streptomyces sp. CBMA29]